MTGCAPHERSFEGGPDSNSLENAVMKENECGARKCWPYHRRQCGEGVDSDGIPLIPSTHEQYRHTEVQEQNRWWATDPNVRGSPRSYDCLGRVISSIQRVLGGS